MLACDARSWHHVMPNYAEKGTLECLQVEHANTKSNAVHKKGSYNSTSLQGKTTMSDILNLQEKMRWSLRQAWPFQRNYVLREACIAEQSKANICVYKAYTCCIFFFFYDRSFH